MLLRGQAHLCGFWIVAYNLPSVFKLFPRPDIYITLEIHCQHAFILYHTGVHLKLHEVVHHGVIQTSVQIRTIQLAQLLKSKLNNISPDTFSDTKHRIIVTEFPCFSSSEFDIGYFVNSEKRVFHGEILFVVPVNQLSFDNVVAIHHHEVIPLVKQSRFNSVVDLCSKWIVVKRHEIKTVVLTNLDVLNLTYDTHNPY